MSCLKCKKSMHPHPECILLSHRKPRYLSNASIRRRRSSRRNSNHSAHSDVIYCVDSSYMGGGKAGEGGTLEVGVKAPRARGGLGFPISGLL